MSYAAQSSNVGDRVTEGDCPTACANNHHYSGAELFSPASACVPCSDIPAYRTAGFIYAYWGAPNAAPWWPRANTPSGLVQSGTVWRQAGVCSPCPYGMDVEPGLWLVRRSVACPKPTADSTKEQVILCSVR